MKSFVFTALILFFSLSLSYSFAQNMLGDSAQTKLEKSVSTPPKPAVVLKNLETGLDKAEKAIALKDSAKGLVKNTIVQALKNPFQNLAYGLSMGVDFARGNQNYANFIPQLDLSFENPIAALNSQYLYNFARLNGKSLNSDLIARNTMSFLPNTRFPIQLLGGGATSKLRNMPARAQTGLGIGFNLLKKEHNKIRLGVNGVVDRSQYGAANFINEVETVSRTRTTYGPLLQLIGQHALSEGRAHLTYDVSTYKAFNKSNDYRFNAISALSFPVFKSLSLRASLIYSYENVILKDTKHGDLFMTFGFGVQRF